MNDHDHDHSEATHTMDCPVCQAPIKVHAHDDEEAVGQIMQAGKEHFEEANHSQNEPMDAEEMEEMARENMKKVE